MMWWSVTPFAADDAGRWTTAPSSWACTPPRPTGATPPRALADTKSWLADGWRTVYVTEGHGPAVAHGRGARRRGHRGPPGRRTSTELTPSVVHVACGSIDYGFVDPALKLAVLTETDLSGQRSATKDLGRMPARRRKTIDPLTLEAGDYIVHEQHGVGRYVEMVQRTVQGATREYLLVEYAPAKRGQPGDRLYVPTDQLEQVTKYVGGEAPTLHRLGGADWTKTKARAKKAVKEIAADLIRLYSRADGRARPRLRRGHPLAARAGGRLPVRGDPRPAHHHRRGQGGHGEVGPDGPADLRRRRLRQDRDRGARRLQGGPGRQAGRGPGADHAAGAAALRHLHRAVRPVPGQRPGAVAASRPTPRPRRRWRGCGTARSTWSSAPTGCSPPRPSSRTSAWSSSTRSSASASSTRSS